MPSPRPSFAERVLLPIGVFVVALAVRLLYVTEAKGTIAASCLVVDQRYYSDWGRAIARGEWLGGPNVFEMTPLYAYFLGLLYRFGATDLFVVRALQAGIGALGCVLLYLVARYLLGRTLSAVVAGFSAALYGPFVFHDGMVMKDFLAVFFIVATTFFLLRAAGGGWRWLFVAGVTLALAALIRENALLLAPALTAWILLRSDPPLPARMCRATAFLAGLMIAVAPVTVRNYTIGSELVFITSAGGAELWMGNNPDADGTYRVPDFVRPTTQLEGEDFRAKARELTGQSLSRRAASRFWLNEALRFIEDHPARFAWLLGRKALLFWNAYEFPDNQNYAFEKTRSRVLGGPLLGFGLIAPLGLLGLALSVREPRRFALAWVMVGVYMLSVMLFFIFSRYRLPAVPFIILFAAHAVTWLADRARERRPIAVSVALGGCAVAWLVTGWDPVGASLHQRRFDVAYTNLAGCHAEAGDARGARELFQRALDVNPKYVGALVGIGNLLYLERNLGAARDAYAAALAEGPNTAEARNGLGSVLLTVKDIDGAVREYRAAVALDPGNAAYVTNLGFALLRQGAVEDADRTYRAAIALAPDFANAHWGLAETAEARGDRAGAAVAWRRYLELAQSEEWKAKARARLGRVPR